MTCGFPAQRVSNAESISMSLYHHALGINGRQGFTMGDMHYICMQVMVIHSHYTISEGTFIIATQYYLYHMHITVPAQSWWLMPFIILPHCFDKKHDMIFRITGLLWNESPVDSPHKGRVIQSFDSSFVHSPKKLLNKQSSCHYFECLNVYLMTL